LSDFIGIDVLGDTELRGKLARLAPCVQDAVADEVGPYLLHVLQTYPPPHHVSRKAAYGKSFQTARQRKWFFWALDNGLINVPYHRTQGLRNAWKRIGSGREQILVNESEAAIWTMDDQRQARLNKLVGWQTIGLILRERASEIRRKGEAGMKKGIRKAGFK
jgi:hypothetical protein